MRVNVDLDRCECHAQCVICAPTVFQLKDENTLVWEPEPEESLREDIEEAVGICPTRAISLED